MEKIECFDRIEEIGEGYDGLVYRISENKCAKVLRINAKHTLEHEFNMSTFLFENKISVPKPYGILKMSFPHYIELITEVFILEYISGGNLCKYNGKEYLKLLERAKLEYENVKKLGVITGDCKCKNVLFSPKKNKIYLIDFQSWKFSK